MHIPDNILVLIEKFQNGTATPEEKYQLDKWYDSFNDIDVEVNANSDNSKFQVSSRIRDRLKETLQKENGRQVVKPSRKLQLGVAATIVFAVVTASIFFIFLSKSPKQEIVKNIPREPQFKNDIAPGGNKAILTLADGSTIVLDSASDGTIGIQGNIKVQKLRNGLLAYTVNGKQVTQNDEAFYNKISTPRGGQYNVTLSDGSKVWLNAASSIRFPVVFIGNERKVEITGEAYFEVAPQLLNKEKKMPFIVKHQATTGKGVEIEVLGTHFNVNAYEDEDQVKTTLLEGLVKVSSPAKDKQTSRILKPGQQAGINTNGKINVIEDADTEEAVAWKNGRFQYKSADLKTILRQMSRWYDVDFVYKDYVETPFSGQLPRTENANKMFELLELTGEVNFTIEGRKIIVSH